MKIVDALEKTGKAMLPEGRVAYEDEFYILRWYDEGTLVMLNNVCSNDWQPYHPNKEIRPREAGELWQYGRDIYFVVGNMTCFMSVMGETSTITSTAIHNQNGWTRLYPPVEEDVERIEIEGVDWFKDGDEVVIPCQARDTFDWKDLLNKPPMKMILEMPKETP